MVNARKGVWLGVIIILAAIVVLGLSACSSSLSEEEEALLGKLGQQVVFTEDAINDERFSPPFYYVYEFIGPDVDPVDARKRGGWKSTSKLEKAETVVFVRFERNQVGIWVDSSGKDTGGRAYINYVEICLIDISDPSRKRAIFGESHPGQVQGEGTVYINGVKDRKASSHWGFSIMVEKLIKMAIDK